MKKLSFIHVATVIYMLPSITRCFVTTACLFQGIRFSDCSMLDFFLLFKEQLTKQTNKNQIYIYWNVKFRERRRERELPFPGWLSRWPQCPELGRSPVGNQEFLWVSHNGCRDLNTCPSSTAFLGTSAGRWIGSGAAEAWTGVHKGHQPWWENQPMKPWCWSLDCFL